MWLSLEMDGLPVSTQGDLGRFAAGGLGRTPRESVEVLGGTRGRRWGQEAEHGDAGPELLGLRVTWAPPRTSTLLEKANTIHTIQGGEKNQKTSLRWKPDPE